MTETNKLIRLIEVAESFIGTVETSENDSPVIEKFQIAGGKVARKQSWCMDFVLYCLDQVDNELGGEKSILFRSESVLQVWNKTIFSARSSYPIVGSIMCWQFGKMGQPTQLGHCGIVTDLDIDAGIVDTIEGNTSPGAGIVREGDGVYAKQRHLVGSVDMKVLGWIIPWTLGSQG